MPPTTCSADAHDDIGVRFVAGLSRAGYTVTLLALRVRCDKCGAALLMTTTEHEEHEEHVSTWDVTEAKA